MPLTLPGFNPAPSAIFAYPWAIANTPPAVMASAFSHLTTAMLEAGQKPLYLIDRDALRAQQAAVDQEKKSRKRQLGDDVDATDESDLTVPPLFAAVPVSSEPVAGAFQQYLTARVAAAAAGGC